MMLERDGDTIVLADSPLVAAGRVKQIPGARHDSQRRVWRFPLSWATCVVARAVFGAELQVGPELATWAREELENRVEPAMRVRQGQ